MSAKILVILTAGLASSLFGASVWATDTTDASVRVAYADLDLSRDAGVEHLYSRLRQAATTACGSADLRDLRGSAAQRKCVTQALDQAVAKINSSRLSSRHALGAVASSVAMRD
jgi:UrcA family protein